MLSIVCTKIGFYEFLGVRAGFPLQSFCEGRAKRISIPIPNALGTVSFSGQYHT